MLNLKYNASESGPMAASLQLAVGALEAVSVIAESTELRSAVGLSSATVLQARAARALASLTPTGPDAIEWRIQAEAVCDLARECMCLAAAVDSDFSDDAVLAGSSEEWSWDFGVAVAESIACGLAAMAAVLQMPGARADADCQALAVGLLEELGRELDCLAAYLFGGLCRLGVKQAVFQEEREQRLQWALQNICAWSLVALGHAVGGFHCFSSSLLLEWASSPLWALTLAKGVLLLSNRTPECMCAISAPAQLQELQLVVLAAVCGLAAPSVAFAAEVSGEVELELDDESSSIERRSMWLASHRIALARAASEIRLSEVLVEASMQCGTGPGLASFLVALLQAELAEDPAWAMTSFEGADVLLEVRQSSAAFCRSLRQHADPLWACLGNVAAGTWSASFLQDCAILAHYVRPVPLLGCQIISAGLSCCSSELLGTLCLFAANAGLGPSDASALAASLTILSLESREALTARRKRWRFPLDSSFWALWAALLEEKPAEPSPLQAATTCEATTPATSAPLPLQSHPPLAGKRGGSLLHELVCGAPAEFRCALDGQLMMDPVQSPYGHVFERTGLAQILCANGGLCPLTGQPLCLEQCTRVPELRRRIAKWVRSALPAEKRKPRLNAGA